jgi:hypothetical protein
MRRVVAICGLIGLSVMPAGSAQPLTFALSPVHSFAPATVRIRARVEPNADNRVLTIVADGPDFYRRSDLPLDGEEAPRTIIRRVTARSSMTVLSILGQ